MSELRLSFPVSAIVSRGRLTSHEIDLLKTEVFPTGVRSCDGATLLLAINNSCSHASAEWGDFFVESLTDFILHHSAPHGMLDDVNTLWLERMLAADGVISTELELRLLLHVMEAAPQIPDSLKVFALSQLRHAIHGGSGALAGRRRGHQRGISAGDIDFLRTVVEVPDNERQVAVSPSVHRVLLSIDAVSNPALNDREWIPFLYSIRAAASVPPAHMATNGGRSPGSRSFVAA